MEIQYNGIKVRNSEKYDDVYVSQDGKNVITKRGLYEPHELKQKKNAYGYMYIVLRKRRDASKAGAVLVHRLVAYAWIGEPATEDMEVDHINRTRDDNRVENLRWVTKKENLENRNLDNVGMKGLKETVAIIEKRMKIMDEKLDKIMKRFNIQ